MKSILRRTWVPLLVVTLAQLIINSLPVQFSAGNFGKGLIVMGVLFLTLFLATIFIGGAVHAGLLTHRSNPGLIVCLVDGAMIGLLSSLIDHFLSVAMHGSSIDLLMPPSDGANPVLWTWKLAISAMLLMIFGLMGILSGGMGGGAGYLVSTLITSAPTIRGRRN
jgi:hypothetical protein